MSATYAFHGLGTRDKLLLKAMVERAAQRADVRWQLALVSDAEYLFCLGDAPANLRPSARVIHLVTDSATVPGVALRFPPRVNDVLATLSAFQGSGATPLLASNDHGLRLAARLLEWLQAGVGTAILCHREGGGWQLDAQRRQAQPIGSMTTRGLVAAQLGDWTMEFGAAPTAPGAVQPIEPILWAIGKASGNDGLLAEVEGRPLKLRSWPYLLADAPRSYTQLALALKQQSLTSAELSDRTQVSREELAGFVNACLLCGFLRPLTISQPISPPPTAPRPGGLSRFLGAVRQALGIEGRA
jgi:hypothetical protein